jgi:4'-phosphopantetheinyl transferase
MQPISLPRTVSRQMSIRRGEVHLDAMLVIALESHIDSVNEVAAELLGPLEATYFSSLRFERRQRSYLLGRYVAKLALRDALSEPDFKSIEIVKGVFEQPIVRCEGSAGWGVTISHAESFAVALAYPAGHPMGVDIELINQSNRQTILSQLSPEEIKWAENAVTEEDKVVVALWTAKEALSKALTTGLMSPIQIYNLTEFYRIDSGIWEGLFQNFTQYKARVWTGSSCALSIAMPKRSVFSDEVDLCTAL